MDASGLLYLGWWRLGLAFRCVKALSWITKVARSRLKVPIELIFMVFTGSQGAKTLLGTTRATQICICDAASCVVDPG